MPRMKEKLRWSVWTIGTNGTGSNVLARAVRTDCASVGEITKDKKEKRWRYVGA